ncbi:hypothetical protein [Streptomyces sp. JH34]|uniref:hypothetical protein n=1 Tax=Streptomyces sp. JH34 TaxID=2793633 RepID=UPI0023F708AA|nr:hypothetical protein [Streptomyces sp. JH34]MDF6020966.1 hypothetical protein [Streptomyces sp. JH34]
MDEVLTARGEVEVAPLRHYIAYRRLMNVASVIFRPQHGTILVYLRFDPDLVALKEGFTWDMRGMAIWQPGAWRCAHLRGGPGKGGVFIRRAFGAD